ncbi:MAG: T9SS type A sorting domain-containing protein [Bacteroidales bacterium]|nr:T9SS type A sorting domain-containing protein [Bacteroidales bacterium]
MKKNFITKTVTILVAVIFSMSAFAAQYTVEGYVFYHNDASKPLQGVNVKLLKMNGQLLQTVQTDATGKYTFFEVHTGNYKLSATSNALAGGINFEDSYLVLLHLLNIAPLNGVALLAADVNADGAVTWADYTAITVGYFLAGTPFSAGPWEFPTTTFVAGGKTGTNLGGTSTGDVNGSFQPNLTKQGMALLNETNGTLEVRSLENIEIPVYAANSMMISGMGLVFEYNTKAFEITDIRSDLSDLQFNILNGQVRISWNDLTAHGISCFNNEALITIAGRTTAEFSNDNSIGLNIGIESHVIDVSGRLIEGFKFSTPAIGWKENANLSHIIYPNPATQLATLEINSFTNTTCNIELYNLQGAKVLILNNQYLQEGINSIDIQLGQLRQGRYIYKIITSTSSFSGGLLISK